MRKGIAMVFALCVAPGFVLGSQKPAKPEVTELRPAKGKLDRKQVPVLHLNAPGELKVFAITYKSGTTFREGATFKSLRIHPSRSNMIYVPEGTYEIEFEWSAYYSSGASRTSGGFTNIFGVSGLQVGPLRMQIEAHNGRHYYLFAPKEFILDESRPAPVTDGSLSEIDKVLEISRKAGIFGVLKVCGFASDKELSDTQESQDRAAVAGTSSACDWIDPAKIRPGEARTESGPTIR